MSGNKSKSSATFTKRELLEEKVKLLDMILSGTCPREITSEGRAFIRRLKTRFLNQIENEVEIF